MAEIIYGYHPTLEAIRAGLSIEQIMIAKERQDKLGKIVSSAQKNGIPIQFVSRNVLEKATGSKKTQGVASFVNALSYSSIAQILMKSEEQRESPLVALLDGIEDPHNLGAILRAADGAGFHGVILPKRRSVGLSPTVAKTSAGALAHVLVAQVSNLNYAIDQLKSKDIWIVGADEEDGQIYYEADLDIPLALVIGAEGRGLHRLVKEKCDFLVKIPMFGKVNSLNASVAAALLFFEARRQRKKNELIT